MEVSVLTPWRLDGSTLARASGSNTRAWSYFYVCQTAPDIDCHQRRDVRDCEAVPGDELVSVQLAIHPFESLMDDRTLRFAVVRELLETTLKDRARILNRASDCGDRSLRAMI